MGVEFVWDKNPLTFIIHVYRTPDKLQKVEFDPGFLDSQEIAALELKNDG